jgi:peptidoglycan/LPS O-acetylase OafA/YrhL
MPVWMLPPWRGCCRFWSVDDPDLFERPHLDCDRPHRHAQGHAGFVLIGAEKSPLWDNVSAMRVTSASPTYYPAFDYLRVVLALTVVIGHAGFTPWGMSGNFAVQVFFVLSGWLISGMLLKSNPGQYPKFYFHRAARIWIPYSIAICLLMTASLMKDHITTKWIEAFFYKATFTFNLFGTPQLATSQSLFPLAGTGSHFWSICAEEQFYLVAPFLIAIPLLGRSIWFWAATSILALASPFWGEFGSISLGVTASVVADKYPDWHLGKPARTALFVVGSILIAATISDLAPYRILAPFAAISIVLYLARRGQLNRFGSFVGGMSFPLYLNHWIGVFIAHALFARFGMRDGSLSIIASVIFNLAIASILYVAIDLNIKKYRDRFYSPQRGIALAATGFFLVLAGVAGWLIFYRVPQ